MAVLRRSAREARYFHAPNCSGDAVPAHFQEFLAAPALQGCAIDGQQRLQGLPDLLPDIGNRLGRVAVRAAQWLRHHRIHEVQAQQVLRRQPEGFGRLGRLRSVPP